MQDIRWMIYGATGYTGVLVAQEAIKRGHRPLLAGRSPDKLELLAARLGLEYVAFRLDDVNTIAEAIADVDIVYHAAGPFVHTSDPMIRACLATGTHYLDITGEINVMEQAFSYDEAARKNGILVMPGVGFDVVPTDCMAKYVAEQVPGATKLDIGFAALSGVSAGTTKATFEILSRGGLVRRNGELIPHTFGQGARKIRFPHATMTTMPIPWGDLSTAYRTTGIPNITTYMALSPPVVTVAGLFGPLGQALMRSEAVRNVSGKVVEWTVRGPNDKTRQTARSYIWARAEAPDGNAAEAWLDTREAYRFTAEIAPYVVEKTAELQPVGAQTPALAFGADFTLLVESTSRHDFL